MKTPQGKAICVFLILLVGSLCPLLNAQERLPAEEILRWFPLDSYGGIYHEETAALRAGASYEAYKEFGRNEFYAQYFYIPPVLFEAAQSCTVAMKVRVILYVEESIDGKREISPNKQISMKIDEENLVAGDVVFKTIWIARTLDADAAIKAALRAGEVAETEFSVRGQEVYTYVGKDRLGSERRGYLCAISHDEILGADDVAEIRLMAATGAGEEASILEFPALESFEEMLPYAGQAIQWFNQVPHETIQLLRPPRDSAEEKILEAAMKRVKHTFDKLSEINTVHGFAYSYDVTGGEMEYRKLQYCRDEDIAAVVLTSQIRPPWGNMYQRHREGRLVISSLAYNVEVTEKRRAERQQREKERKRQEEKKETRK